MPAASAGETWGRSPTLCVKVLALVLLGVAGRDELGELTTDGGYHEFVVASCGLGSTCCSCEPLKISSSYLLDVPLTKVPLR